MAEKKLSDQQRAVADFLIEFSRVSSAEGIGPCALAAIVMEYAKWEDGIGGSYLAPVIKAAGAEANRAFEAMRAREA